MFDGNAFWRFIHFFAFHNVGRDLFNNLDKYIDCQKCKESYTCPLVTEDLLQWSIKFHNQINIKLNKPILNPNEIEIDGTCDICNKKQPQLLWILTHNVAEAGGNDAINFLKSFNEQFPCEVCRGTLFPDVPQEGENCLFWTFRHRKRDNDDKNIDAFIYEMNPLSNTDISGCPGCPGAV